MDIVSFQQGGEDLRKNMSLQELKQEGKKSSTIKLLYCLTDKRRVKNGKSAVVGFRLYTTEEVTYTEYKLNNNFKNLLDCTKLGEKTVSANSEFIVNLREMVELISRVEYAGEFTGDGITAYLSAKDILKAGYMFPMIKVRDKLISEYCVAIQDSDNNMLPEYQDKFGVINTRVTVNRHYSSDSVRDIAAAFRDLYK